MPLKLKQSITNMFSILIAIVFGYQLPAEASEILSFRLSEASTQGFGNCKLKWEVNNKTSFNITNITFEPNIREQDGTILKKGLVHVERVKPERTFEYTQTELRVTCEEIAEIQFERIRLLFVDGESRRDLFKQLESALRFSSDIENIVIVSHFVGGKTIKRGTQEYFDAIDIPYEIDPECSSYRRTAKEIQRSYKPRFDNAEARSDWDEFRQIGIELSEELKPVARKGGDCVEAWLEDNGWTILDQ